MLYAQEAEIVAPGQPYNDRKYMKGEDEMPRQSEEEYLGKTCEACGNVVWWDSLCNDDPMPNFCPKCTAKLPDGPLIKFVDRTCKACGKTTKGEKKCPVPNGCAYCGTMF